MSLTSWAVSTSRRTCSDCGRTFETSSANRSNCLECRPRWSSVSSQALGRVECRECGELFTPGGHGRRAVFCRTCKTRQAFLASQCLPSRPIAESDYAQALIPLVEAYERDQRRAARSRKVDLDGLFARDALAALVEGPVTARRFGNQLGITGESYKPAKFLALHLERAGWVETERVPSAEGGLLIALPHGKLPPPMRAALLGGREGQAKEPEPEGATAAEREHQAPDVDHREELDDRRAREELRRRRWADGTWRRRHANNLKTKKRKRRKERAMAGYKPRDCRDCGEEFTPVGPSQGRRSRCYDCAPKGGTPQRSRKVEEPVVDEEAEELEEEDDGEVEGVTWTASTSTAPAELEPVSEVRERLEGLGRAAGLLGISLARRGLGLLEDRLR